MIHRYIQTNIQYQHTNIPPYKHTHTHKQTNKHTNLPVYQIINIPTYQNTNIPTCKQTLAYLQRTVTNADELTVPNMLLAVQVYHPLFALIFIEFSRKTLLYELCRLSLIT